MGGAISLEEEVEHLNNIINKLTNLEASTEQIAAVRRGIDGSILRTLQGKVYGLLRDANKDKVSVFEYLNIEDWGREEFEQFIQENDLQTTTDAVQSLVNLQFFILNRDLPISN